MAARTTDVAIGLRSRSTRGEFTVVSRPRTLTIELQVPGGCQNRGGRSLRDFNGMQSVLEPQGAQSVRHRIPLASRRRVRRIDPETQVSRSLSLHEWRRAQPRSERRTRGERHLARRHRDQAAGPSGSDKPSMAAGGACARARRVVSAINPSKPSWLHSSSQTCGASGLSSSNSSRRTTSSAS